MKSDPFAVLRKQLFPMSHAFRRPLPIHIRLILFPLALLLLSLSSPRIHAEQTFVLHFDEPLVSKTIVDAEESLPPADRGTDMFTVTGDTSHTPQGKWIDQDMLCLSFPKGTSCNTLYTLTFKPGTKFLSGRSLPKRSYRFSCPTDTLACSMFTDKKGTGILVTPNGVLSRESLNFSTATPIRYSFREVKHTFWQGEPYLGSREVGAVTEPARLEHGTLRQTLRRMADSGEAVWKNLRPQSQLPGHIVVRPAKPLDPDKEWALVCEPAPGSGFEQPKDLIRQSFRFHPIPELVTWATADYDEKDSSLLLAIHFNEPVKTSDMLGIFQRMKLASGENQAANAADGKSKTLSVNGQDITFTYEGVKEPEPKGARHYISSLDKALVYRPQGVATAMLVRASAPAPVLLDIILPSDTTSSLGLSTDGEHHHRIALNPAWPMLEADKDGRLTLPLKGDHTLRFPATNLQAIDATIRIVPEEKALQAFNSDRWDTEKSNKLRFQNNINILRKRSGLSAPDKDATWKSLKNSLDSLQEEGQKRKQLLEGMPAFPTRRTLVSCNGMLSSAEAALDLDAIAGRRLASGMYIVTLRGIANNQVRQASAMQEQKDHALDHEIDVLVQITDLNAIPSSCGLLVTRYSDGSAPVSGEWHIVKANGEEMECREIRQGVSLKPIPSYDSYADKPFGVIVSGDDRVVANMPLGPDKSDAGIQNCRVLLIHDRPMYRPGDTVHLRGVLRRMADDGTSVLPDISQVKLTVARPDGTELVSRDVKLGEFGAFAEDFDLPTGEEDVAGNYDVSVKGGDFSTSASIPCQVFRRDAFETTLEADLDPVAPEKFTVRISAQDYNGTPLAGGKVQLDIENPSFYDYFSDREQESLKESHKLTLDANGRVELTLPISQEQAEAGRLKLSGSVANDREEYVVLPETTKEFSPADFRVSYDDGRIILTDSRTKQTLGRAQTLQLKLMQKTSRLPSTPSGFAYEEDVTSTLWEGSVDIPARAERGVPLPPALLAAKDKAMGNTLIELRGDDSEGRQALCRITPYMSVDDGNEEKAFAKAEWKEDGLELQAFLPHSGQAHVFISVGNKLRHTAFDAQEGENKIRIPLLQGEEGEIGISLTLPDTGKSGGLFCTYAETSCFVPAPSKSLEIQLNAPGEKRPGETAVFSGKVSGQQKEAEVTLYAVDAGMLSVSRYEPPQPQRFFSPRSASRFIPDRAKSSSLWISNRSAIAPLSAVWQGDLVGRGYKLRRKDENGTWPISDSITYADDIPLWLMEEEPRHGILTSGSLMTAEAPAAILCSMVSDTDEDEPMPRLRSNFEPVAVWKGAVLTEPDGSFHIEAVLPDTLTTYRIFAVALDRSGRRFGSAEGRLRVSQPVMMTPGTPLFMSLGDRLSLPVSITNNTDEDGVWNVWSEEAGSAQEIALPAHGSGTLYFDFQAKEEGEQKLRWNATGKPGQDAVEGSFAVRFPAPLLKETRRFALAPGQNAVKIADLFAEELGSSSRSEAEVTASANPVLHLAGCIDFLLQYPYGCTEQKASALLPWLMYDNLAPFCPLMARTSKEQAAEQVRKTLQEIWARQCKDGGFGYWSSQGEGIAWVSAYNALVLQVAQKAGYEQPKDKMDKLLDFLKRSSMKKESPLTRYAAATALGRSHAMQKALAEALEPYAQDPELINLRPEQYANLVFLSSLQSNAKNSHEAFLAWLRSVGRDYRHSSTQSNGWTLLALHAYISKEKSQSAAASTLSLGDGRALQLGQAATAVPINFHRGQRLNSLAEELSATDGTAYVTVRAKAQPEKTEFPGVTEQGLQVTRLYETKGEDGIWRPAEKLHVGDVVRVTLTCAKVKDELKYFVLEDYLPSCMEAINPEVSSQAAGLEPLDWSEDFDHREYLADRVRGFCTRWAGRNLLNMRYYARVKRSGESIAPPAQAQLMYEPQTYGLSPNAHITALP